MARTDRAATERRNPRSRDLDRMTSLETVRFINEEDRKIASVISKEAKRIAWIVDNVVKALREDGRVFYVGAGTSGRLGVLDATEVPSTFGLPRTAFQGIIAGGWRALRRSIEGAEDDRNAAEAQLERTGFCKRDILIGLSASGRTPFVLAAMRKAGRIGARCYGITCNPSSEMARVTDVIVTLRVGPEVLAGSSRMKCGTAQKMVLNIISTASMIRLGRAQRGLMTHVQPRSQKLQRRAVRIISEVAEVDLASAEKALARAKGDVKTAALMLRLGVSAKRGKEIILNSRRTAERIHSLIQAR